MNSTKKSLINLIGKILLVQFIFPYFVTVDFS